MKITYRQALELKKPLTDLIQSKQRMPLKVSYFFSKIIKALDEEFVYFDGTKNKILSEYSVKDENGEIKIEDGSFIIKQDCIEKFNNELNELLSIEINLPVEKMSIDDLNSNLEVSIEDMMILEILFK